MSRMVLKRVWRFGDMNMKYKDEKGNTLYGFSQENLEKTNREIRKTNTLMLILIIFLAVTLGLMVSFGIWLDAHDIFTRLIG